MTKDEIKATVIRVLTGIAPEVDPASLKSDVSFREQLDMDSMDYLNFVIALDEEFHAGIPESDYTKFDSVNSCVERIDALFTARFAEQKNA